MPLPVALQNEPTATVAVIAISASLTGSIHIPNGHQPAGIIMPATWTAAGITFQVSIDNASFANAFDTAGDEIALTVVAAHYVPIAPNLLNGARYIKIRSGTAASAVNQAAARTLTLVTRPV